MPDDLLLDASKIAEMQMAEENTKMN